MTTETTKATFTRKHFFIDRNLQGRYMVTFLVPMLVMLVFMLATLAIASQSVISTSSNIMRREIDNIIATETQDNMELVDRYAPITEPIRAKLNDFGSISNVMNEFAGTLILVFGAGILLVVLQIVMMTVFFSHKLAGPVYRFEKACKNVINGNYNDVIYLRRGDQMTNLASLLNEAMKVSGDRIVELESKIAELEKQVKG